MTMRLPLVLTPADTSYTAIVRGRRRNSWCRAGRSLRPRLATSASCWLDWLRGPRSSNTRVTGERSGR